MNSIKDRVMSGMKLLDENVPDWKQKININKLDMSSQQNCILGQIFGSFTNGVVNLFRPLYLFDPVISQLTIMNGFNTIKQDEESYKNLTDVWRNILNETR